MTVSVVSSFHLDFPFRMSNQSVTVHVTLYNVCIFLHKAILRKL